MSSGLLVLGLLVASGTSQSVAQAVSRLARWCKPRLTEPEEAGVRAWFATSFKAVGLPSLAADPSNRVAVWIQHPAEVDRAASNAITVADASKQLPVDFNLKLDGIDLSRTKHINPLMRQRYRRALDLPQTWIVDLSDRELGDALTMTSLAVASSVIVSENLVVYALASGAPTVTDETAATKWGCRDGVELLIADPDEQVAAAQRLSGDLRLAASMSRVARRLAESAYDTTARYRELAEALGLIGGHLVSESPMSEPENVMSRLGTPDEAWARALIGDISASGVN